MKIFCVVFVTFLASSISSPIDQVAEDVVIPTTTKALLLNEEEVILPVIAQSDGDRLADETVVADSTTELDKDIISNDDAAVVTTEGQDIFPTPLPFLPVPDIYTNDFVASSNPLPPNFDPTKIGVSIRVVNNSAYYTGRAACECGRNGIRLAQPRNSTKIVNGVPAHIEEYPWTVGLLRRSWLGTVSKSPYCGGTLINNKYIATASHCVDGMSASGIIVALHEEDFSSTSELESETVKINVERVIMHPNYNRRSIDNDIALLKLSKPVELGKVFVPACLPANNDHVFEGETGTVAGWGATSEGGSTSSSLRKVDVPILSNNDCNTKTKYNGKITDNMMCAGDIEKGEKDSCQGDSGGPMVIENGGRRTLVGIVSWGYGCARPMSPGVYTRVGRYSEWVLANTPSGDWCSG